MVRRARAPQVPERGCGRYGADERADADVECDAPEGWRVTRGFDLQPTLLLHSTVSRRCNSPIRARTSALALAVCSGEGSNSPAAHRRTVCRLTPMVRASSLCHSGPQTNRPKRSSLAASRRFTLSLLTAGRD